MGSRIIEKRICWVVICFILLLKGNIVDGAQDQGDGTATTLKQINIGVFIDSSTRIGKEQEVGINIAAQDFNNTNSENIKVKLHYLSSNSSSNNPLQTAYSAIDLIQKKKIQVIITGTDSSEELTLLGEIGNQYKVPVISLSAAYLIPVKMHSFMVHMSYDYSVQIDYITSLIKTFGWKKVIAVYEQDGGYGSSTSSMLDLFSKALQNIESEMEYCLALPRLAYMSNPKDIITEELVKVFSMESRVFVFLHSSLPLVDQLFREAYNMGLVGTETAWIITDTIASLLDSLNSSTISNMEGTLGIKAYYNESTNDYATFSRKYLLKFLTLYPNEVGFQFGIHALRGYDAVSTVVNAIHKFPNNESISSQMLMQGILTSNFTGLSGEISFKNGLLDKDHMLYSVVNVVGKSYKGLKLLSPKSSSKNTSDILNNMSNGMVINWPGYIKDVPRGWVMPSDTRPLRVGVPGDPPFDNFVVVENSTDKNRTMYTGFCIDVFLEAVKIVEESYSLPFEFEVFYGTYDELVDRVYDKTYDIAVGDITILANRSNFVDFTQPYTKSGLSMVVPLESKESQKALMFVRPFTWQLWLVTFGTLLYTTFVIWCIESRIPNNSDFEGGYTQQFNVALWFTCCSIFNAQREKIQSNLTRTTMIVWFFVVFALTSSYTASLTSMLTVPLLEPRNVKDIDWLIKTHSTIGCDGGSVWDYLVNILHFSPQNIINISSQYDYQDLFANGTIVTAFLEIPYQKLLVNEYCKSYIHTKETFGFGGQGFVFQKGSPIVDDISRAMLTLSENGVLKQLEDKWFPTSSECLTSLKNHDVERLNPMEFLGLYLIYFFISAICLLSYAVEVIRNFHGSTSSSMNWMINFVLDRVFRNSRISPVYISDTITLELSNYTTSP